MYCLEPKINCCNQDMEDVTLTVLVLAYNHENSIRRTIESILEQKSKYKMEILIHDDASTDNTAQIIREYAEKYPDMIKPIFQKKNQYSKNIGIIKTFLYPKIKSKYWTLLDGDDYWRYDKKVEEAVDFLEKNKDYHCYATNTIYKYTNKTSTCLDEQRCFEKKFNPDISFENYYYLHTSSRIYRRIFPHNTPHDNRFGDTRLFLDYIAAGKVFCDKKCTSVYNSNGLGVWSSKTREEKKFTYVLNSYKNDKRLKYKYHNFFKSRLLYFEELECCVGRRAAWALYLTLLFFKQFQKKKA